MLKLIIGHIPCDDLEITQSPLFSLTVDILLLCLGV